MITIDIVMPTGGSKGGVERVISAWANSFISEKYNLRIFHTYPGKYDYLYGYTKQWTMMPPDTEDFKLDLRWLSESYAYFIKEHGSPDICLATWIPMMSSACSIVRKSLDLDFVIVSWIHSGIGVYNDTGWGGIEHLNYADYHFCISKKNYNDLSDAFGSDRSFYIGNPVSDISINSCNVRK